MLLWISEVGEMDVKQLYGRNDMVMLEQHNKIYGSLGIAEQTILKTVEGNPAVLENPKSGVAENVITDFKMQGWTEQAQYEGKNLFEIPDITAETFETKIECNITQPITISATNEVTVSTKIWRFRVKYKDGTYVYAIDSDLSLVKTFDASEENPIIEIIYRSTYITSGAYRNVQIEYGESATAYEPYTGGKPSPSPDYPQEIVSAGKYNEDTQKWEYEITIANAQTDATKNQSVTLTSDRPLTKWDKLEKRNGQWGWVYKSEEIESYTDESVPGEYFSTTGRLSTGAQVWYETATETFIPLSESEQEQMNALEMYLPTTVITNNVDCNMIVTYKSTQNGGESE